MRNRRTCFPRSRRNCVGAIGVRELDSCAYPDLEQKLTAALILSSEDVYRAPGPLQVSYLTVLAELDPRPELRVEHLVPVVPPLLREAESLLAMIRAKDQVLHHP